MFDRTSARITFLLFVLFAALALSGCGEDAASAPQESNDALGDTAEVLADTDQDTAPQTSCDDGEKNGAESDTDCGGECAACPDGGTCAENTDCESNSCGDGFCSFPTCFDGAQNTTESDTDCGGECPPCQSGKVCKQNRDCVTGDCLPEGICSDPSCDDGVLNADESSIDCGGECEPCAAGSSCSFAEDCESRICDEEVCATPDCQDHVQNGTEADVDCGGGLCNTCQPLDSCFSNSDCSSGVCVAEASKCIGEACQDGVLNAGEADLDCGGPFCLPCDNLQACRENRDCSSGICNGAARLCTADHCINSSIDSDETDFDCGGLNCLPCEDGEACLDESDCLGGSCNEGVCFTNSCGDGVLDLGEDCDDAGESLTCDEDCSAVECGDGQLNSSAGETCDDGDANSNSSVDACRLDCGPARCGDGVLDGGESCDDGNVGAGDGCAADCSVVEIGFSCDGSSPALCAPDCGDGIVAGEEACDDSNLLPGDGCAADCSLIEEGFSCSGSPSICQIGCGDGLVNAGEECDAPSLPTATCDLGCTFAVCGDGTLNILAGESCDEGSANADNIPDTCRVDCSVPSCGDGVRDSGEACDDGNNASGDGCTSNCSNVEYGFSCSGISPDLCSSACGDGLLASNEICDDGNSVASDGCNSLCSSVENGWGCVGEPSACSATLCGDGIIAGTEVCDDGDGIPNDGCNTLCRIEPGWICSGTPSICSADYCGDEIIAGTETCDDGNSAPTDGCGPLCSTEPGWSCTGSPSVCNSSDCGDGVTAGSEVCDDGINDGGEGECFACSGIQACGDSITDGTETCDDGNTSTEACAYGDISCIVCSSTCAAESGVTSYCSDGVVDSSNAETCDDNNSVTEACFYGEVGCTVCSATCISQPGATSYCGDSSTDSSAGEGCDDGNTVTESCLYGETSCTVCSATCVSEPGMVSYCGDGIRDISNGEECDDGNTLDGDGCDTACAIEIVLCNPSTISLISNIQIGQSRFSRDASGFAPQAMALSHDGNLVIVQQDRDELNFLNPNTGNDLGRINVPKNNLTGITWDESQGLYFISDYSDNIFDSGFNLYTTTLGGNTNPAASETEATHGYPLTSNNGLLYRGALSTIDDWSNLREIRVSSSASPDLIIDTLVPGLPEGIGDMAHDGQGGIWVLGFQEESNTPDNAPINIYRIDATTGALTHSYLNVANAGFNHWATGLAFDNGKLYVYNWTGNTKSTLMAFDACIAGFCGDGALDPGEECDDGNTFNGDGCDISCVIESGSGFCGNGVVDVGEECDDGNTLNGDGCDMSCVIELTIPICAPTNIVMNDITNLDSRLGRFASDYAPQALSVSHDGDLAVVQQNRDEINFIEPFSGNFRGRINIPTRNNTGLAWDETQGVYFVSDYTDDVFGPDLYTSTTGGFFNVAASETDALSGYPLAANEGLLYRGSLSTDYDWSDLREIRVSTTTDPDTIIKTLIPGLPEGIGDMTHDGRGGLWILGFQEHFTTPDNSPINLYRVDAETGILTNTYLGIANAGFDHWSAGVAFLDGQLHIYNWTQGGGSTLMVFDICL